MSRPNTLGILTLALASCTRSSGPPPASPGPVVVIVNVTAIPMDSARVIRDAAVIVRGDRIAWVGPMREAVIPRGAERVDARGAFVLPGLADLHVHTDEQEMPLYLRNGVTTIRELNGSPVLLSLRDRVRRGAVLGPNMHVAGTLLAGERIRWRHRLI